MDTNQVGLILTGLSLVVGLATLLLPDEVRKLRLQVRLLGVLGLVIGLALIVAAAAGTSDTGNGPEAAATPTRSADPTDSTASMPSSTDSTEGSSGVAVRWHEKIRVPESFEVDLDDTSPRVGDSVSGTDLYSTTSQSDTTAGFYLYAAVATAPAAGPSFAGCRSAIETAALAPELRLEPGKAVCIRTEPDSGEQPHLAHAKVLTVDRRSAAVTLDVTVWRQEP